jgi:hypothetical protein
MHLFFYYKYIISYKYFHYIYSKYHLKTTNKLHVNIISKMSKVKKLNNTHFIVVYMKNF